MADGHLSSHRLKGAPSRTGGRRLVVAIHDVAPPFEPEVRTQIARLREAGVDRFVFKVVPNWQGSYPLDRSDSLADLLRSEVAAGGELVLHGLEHRQRGRLVGSPVSRLRTALFAGGAAEFMALDERDAERAVREGLDVFDRAGLPRPTGFSSPCWLLNDAAERALCRAGLRWLVGMFFVRDLLSSRRLFLPGFGYMGTSGAHELVVQCINGLLIGPVLTRASAAKAYLHPQGNHDTLSYRWSLATISRLIGEQGWTAATYAELCGESKDVFRARDLHLERGPGEDRAGLERIV